MLSDVVQLVMQLLVSECLSACCFVQLGWCVSGLLSTAAAQGMQRIEAKVAVEVATSEN